MCWRKESVKFLTLNCILNFRGNNTEALVISRRLKFPQDDRTDTHFIAPLRMHFQSTLYSRNSGQEEISRVLCTLVLWIGGNRRWVPLSADRYDLANTKQTESQQIFIYSHCKVQSHNPKEGCACREKKRIPDFYRTYCPRFDLIYLPKLAYRKWEQVINSLY